MILPYRTDVSMFRLRSNVLLLLLLAVALQQVALSSSSIADEYAPDSEVLLAEEEESSSSSVDTLELEIQLVALKESHRDESLPPANVIGALVGSGEPLLEVERGLATTVDEEEGWRGAWAVAGTSCDGNMEYFKLVLRMDAYAFENSWTLLKSNNGGDNWSTLAKGPPSGTNYQDNKRYTGGYCLQSGTYKFIINDKFKDGMHAGTRGDGGFVGYVNGVKRFASPVTDSNWAQKSYQFRITSSSSGGGSGGGGATSQAISQQDFTPKADLDNIDAQWLTAHNSRRKEWHTRYGKSYVALVWNDKLAAQATAYARELLSTCGGTLVHDNTPFGENMASNLGTGSWGKARTPEEVLVRWVDKEVNTNEKAHLTQALWRSSNYLGCGTATKAHNGGDCHVQVCRYARPGNCNMGAYGNDWVTPTMADDSPCTPFVP